MAALQVVSALEIEEREEGASHELDEDEHVQRDDLADVVWPVYQQLRLHLNLNYSIKLISHIQGCSSALKQCNIFSVSSALIIIRRRTACLTNGQAC